MIYGSRMPPRGDFPPPQEDLPPVPDDPPPSGKPSFRTILQLIKLVLMIILLFVKCAGSHSSGDVSEPASPPDPDPNAINVQHVVTREAVAKAFGENVTGGDASSLYELFYSSNGEFVLMAFLSAETAGHYEEKNRKTGDTVQKVEGLGEAAEFITGDKSQDLIVQQGEYLIALSYAGLSDAPVVDRKTELLALGKLCCANLNRLIDR